MANKINATIKPTSIGCCIEIGPLFLIDGVPKYAYIYLDNIRPDEMDGSLLGGQAMAIARKFVSSIATSASAEAKHD